MITLVLADRRGGLFDYSNKLRGAMDSDADPLVFVEPSSTFAGRSLFLQYSGYGFARRGAPRWLLSRLKTDRDKIGVLGIFFHELYAFGPPWSSAFWLSPAQRQIASGLVSICDYWVTNRNESADWIRRHGGATKPGEVLCTFSNVGEPENLTTETDRQIAVFGTPAVRAAAYLAGGQRLVQWVARGGYKICDIGDPIHNTAVRSLFKRLKPVEEGRLPEAEVSRCLQRSRFGLLSYRPSFLAKSGVFAAYVAHGVPCLLLGRSETNQDGLRPGVHFLAGLPEIDPTESEWRRIRVNALDWYSGHRLRRHVDAVNNLAEKVLRR